MGVYSLRIPTPSLTDAAVSDCVVNVWNPASAQRIVLLEMGIFKRAGVLGDRLVLNRTSTRGTPGATETPGVGNAWANDDVSPSGVVGDSCPYTVLPTREIPALHCFAVTQVTGCRGSGWQWTMPRGMEIAPGSGVGIFTATTVLWASSEVYFVWKED